MAAHGRREAAGRRFRCVGSSNPAPRALIAERRRIRSACRGLARKNTIRGLGDLIEPRAAFGLRAAKPRRNLTDRKALLDRGQEIEVFLRAPHPLRRLGHGPVPFASNAQRTQQFHSDKMKGPAVRPSLSTRAIAECLATQKRSPSLFSVTLLLAHAPPRIHERERQHRPEEIRHGLLLLVSSWNKNAQRGLAFQTLQFS